MLFSFPALSVYVFYKEMKSFASTQEQIFKKLLHVEKKIT